MKTIGFPVSRKENENRRAILPEDLEHIRHTELMFFESEYGNALGYTDEDYIKKGANIVSFDEVLKKDIICDPKIGDVTYIDLLNEGQTLFGWIHAAQNKKLTNQLIDLKLNGIAWENMDYKGRHVFWRNNELAGESAVINGYQYYGKMPYETKVAIIGRGNTARGAIRILNCLGADCTTYDRKTVGLIKEEIWKYDVIVNCVLWDINNDYYLLDNNDLKNMKRDSMIIDVSCDRGGAIESCKPTSIEEPIYMCNGILHYVVDHTPAIFHKTSTRGISEAVYPYIDKLIEEELDNVLEDATIIKDGKVIDEKILINL